MADIGLKARRGGAWGQGRQVERLRAGLYTTGVRELLPNFRIPWAGRGPSGVWTRRHGYDTNGGADIMSVMHHQPDIASESTDVALLEAASPCERRI